MSSWSPIILIELILVFGSVLGWGLWELRTLRREKERDAQKARAAQAALGGSAAQAAVDESSAQAKLDESAAQAAQGAGESAPHAASAPRPPG